MSEPGDARKIMQGCDLTADCPAVEHASDCWRGYWTARVDAAIGAFYVEALERTPPDLRTRFITAFRERMSAALQAAKGHNMTERSER